VSRWSIVSTMAYDDIDTDSLRGVIRRIIRTEDDLEPNIWRGRKLKRDVREALMTIAQDVWDDMVKGRAKLIDVTLTGSCAGYRWSPTSDVDVHLIVQYSDVDDYEELVGSYFKARTALWDKEHDVTLHGHPVEVYVQDVDEVQWSSGVYSLMHDKWIAMPVPPSWGSDDDIDYRAAERKARTYARDIQRAVAALRAHPGEQEISRVKKLKARVRQLRRSGLEREGELSIENLAFKALRKIGALDILHAEMQGAYDISRSLD
jgi:hypothetical protein